MLVFTSILSVSIKLSTDGVVVLCSTFLSGEAVLDLGGDAGETWVLVALNSLHCSASKVGESRGVFSLLTLCKTGGRGVDERELERE